MSSTTKEILDAGLHYSTDQSPGITRIRKGKGFAYHNPKGNLIEDSATRDRIARLVIPPAWKNVWICPDPRGHVQATGRDAKGRKQTLYHPSWRSNREENKFHRVREFGAALPSIRKRVNQDLQKRGLPKERVVAAVVSLLEKTLIRVGNREYAKSNKSYGLTTLRCEHLELGSQELRFKFRGKSGKLHDVTCMDRRLTRVVRRVQDLPGESLFQYLDGDEEPVEITSGDVNEYLREATGSDFTAKDFRTWAATVEAARLRRDGEERTSVIRAVARRLGNTPAVCRKSYIHPAIFESEYPEWLDQKLPRAKGGLDPIERFVIESVLR